MSMLIASLFVVLVMLIGNYVEDLGHITHLRARSQVAADAAALAAVSEASPYGSGAPESAALRFASLNGADLLSCDCEPGSIEAQVEVEIDGVSATARAVLDVEAITPVAVTGRGGLDPRLALAVDELTAASQGRVHVASGWRSPEHQRHLWDQALARYGSPEVADNWVAPPGRSMHEVGLAVDLGGDLELAVSLVQRFGLPLYRPMPWEPWHFELLGSRG